MKPERDTTRLPKWAQQELYRLERDLESAYARLAEGPENSNTFADPYAKAPRALGDSPMIEFRFGTKWGEKFQVRLEDDHLVISGGSSLAIHPRSSNGINVAVAS